MHLCSQALCCAIKAVCCYWHAPSTASSLQKDVFLAWCDWRLVLRGPRAERELNERGAQGAGPGLKRESEYTIAV